VLALWPVFGVVALRRFSEARLLAGGGAKSRRTRVDKGGRVEG